MTNSKTFAAASLALLLAGTAQAATFDFTFFSGFQEERPLPEGELRLVLQPERIVIGTGVMSYEGPVAEGISNLEDLDDLSLNFTIGEWSWDESDITPTLLNVFWAVEDQGDFFSGSFGADRSIVDLEVRSVQAEPVCGLVGSILLYNGEQCFTASPSFGFPDQYAIYEADSMILQTVQAEPMFGLYQAIARVGQPPAPVPLPATLPLLALAVGGMGYLRSRKS